MAEQTPPGHDPDPANRSGREVPPGPAASTNHRLPALLLGAVGVVYGDIGTSPLYTMREAFGFAGGMTVADQSVLGVLSLVFWALIVVVTVKYVVLVLRADNRGEGGVLSLVSLILRKLDEKSRWRGAAVLLSMLGLALFYGDSLITPAISVLSAVEGLQVATPVFESYVVPIALVILIALFLIQSRGTARVGGLFGPIMLLWFSTLALLGALQIVRIPEVLRAINPAYAVDLFAAQGWRAFVVLGAVVLAITGAEALYADMGHFGRRPIRMAWFGLVLPALLLNYFGQGALLLSDPSTVVNPFYLLAPSWARLPMVLLATAATVIASQAVISGAFSLTRQAVQLGYLPRMEIRHTSEETIGQIYIPRVNWTLLAGIVLLVFLFGSSSNLAAAYGIAVTGAMSIDAVLVGFIAASLWGWNRWVAIGVFGALLAVDLAFFGANSLKIPQGGWFPLLIAGGVFVLVSTWVRGRRLLFDRLDRDALPLARFVDQLGARAERVSGTAIFMTANNEMVPHALLHNLKHNKVLHDRVVIMTVKTQDVPRVPAEQRISVEPMGKGFYRVTARFGFVERPDVPKALALCRREGLAFDLAETSFFLSRETMVPTVETGLPRWRESIFIAISSTALAAESFFCIPPGRVVEMGTQIEI